MKCVCLDNGTESVRAEMVELLDHHGVRRQYVHIGFPKHNDVVERLVAMTVELAMASGIEAPRLFGDARLPRPWPLWSET